MKLDVILSADEIVAEEIIGKVAVVIDVLRATSTMITSLANGYKQILPVVSIEEAKELSASLKEKHFIAGERNGVKIKGFDFGNSPCDYIKSSVRKKLILTTTNGTKCFTRLQKAQEVIILSLLNMKAVIDWLQKKDEIVFCCAGRGGQFALDDFITAGKAIAQLSANNQIKLSDTAKVACDFYSYNKKSILKTLKNSASGQNLVKLGKESDIEFIASGEFSIVPFYKDHKIEVK
ncbi:phosphosulfolactate phosphohydrolase-like enzyme [Halobacteroides halobius DSM 5150]|uniref:Probable 2-phosphosulfolactate phosphatase n=1 Tax=Halobacteroides halobius (strain ATCC 35273 / DSM 5150 / MD-1) TaxID=748449 RepID=L0KA88_HALHC|nr:2-phosphosulfolactate phosphatase [Halobacteroides halobius]AGB41450.1 phosphosulfolactate phosphohydrolase-like enzyme [Halobacteroides halobius DSM 5150]